MHKTFLALFVSLSMCALAQADGDTAAALVMQRDRTLNELIQKHEVEAARDLYDEQFVLTTSTGKQKNKANMLAEIASKGLTLDLNETSEVVVRVRDNTALLTGILRQRGSYNGKTFDVRLRVTDTWVFSDGIWRIIGGHASPFELIN